ncbi:3-oxoacid CoA-transferase subunit A [Sphingopyxis sp. JAI128]|uniref:3-oxoacid CoA-transferase subunit A n=1 Tax=Sphingopyxis sp. JAI128 TaxID=2723066 RepID=UPI00161D54FC|nr:3-oxoacid CoA-transferase subunit A [Sphingopyxis sp. JAI128]MBB6427858.1 3-oxoadipate CoA-transferase alpha subunit [Sphingopyxis sp. JAI128]
MIDKRFRRALDALHDVPDGATILVSGFGEAGNPTELIHALIEQGARDLTVVNNNAGNGEIGLALLLKEQRVRKIVCSFPRGSHSHVFDELYRAGRIELELVPQGTLAERIRAAGAGIPAFYTPTGVGTEIARGKETRSFGGRDYLLETALSADFALIKAERADRWGNLLYNKAARNFAPVMAAAAKVTIVQARHVLEPGDLDPETIVTPSIFVDRIVHVPDPVRESDHLAALDKARPA